MTGMKQGAGEDPFAEEVDATVSDSENQTSEDHADAEPEDDATEESQESVSRRRSSRQQPMNIPYIYRRDGVQDGRDRVPLFLQKDTKNAERDALRKLEERFDDDVSLTDLREALMKVGLEHLDEVEDHLEEWGYGLTFTE
jgi:hypothetical protein